MKRNIIKEEMRKVLVREVATHYVESKTTIRKTASLFGKSKSWVHRILKVEVGQKCPDLADEVTNAIVFNKNERYKRGGEATKKKYESLGGK